MIHKNLSDDSIPDDRVLSPAQASAMLGISIHTLQRIWARGAGPKKLRLSTRRIGITVRELRAYQRSLEVEPAA